MTTIRVSDHALVRYLERVMQIDLDRMRKGIADAARVAAANGADRVVLNGVTLAMQPDEHEPGQGFVITTIWTEATSKNKPHKGRQDRNKPLDWHWRRPKKRRK